MDHLTTARTEPELGSISSPTTAELGSTARRLVVASVSPNTRESYTRALRQFDTWRGRMVAHYSAGATAEQGAVACYL